MKQTTTIRRLIIPAVIALVLFIGANVAVYADEVTTEDSIEVINLDASILTTEDDDLEGEVTPVKQGVYFEGGSYYFYLDGVIKKAAKIEYEGKIYFAKADGTLAQNERIKIDSKYYYAGADCSFAVGIIVNDKGAKYYADENGVLNMEGIEFETNGTNRVTNDYGQIKSDQFIISNGNTYYCGSNGKVTTGIFVNKNGKRYYADENGHVAVSEQWVEFGGKKYRVSTGGALYTSRAIKVGDSYYWMGPTGSLDATTFIVIDIATQRLGFYKDSALVVASGIVTGKDSTPTPKGIFKVTGLLRNITLSGTSGSDSWDSPVDYWIAFIGSSIGLHDASWRSNSEFNKPNLYHKDGSHGCVNMPRWAVQTIYNSLWAMPNHGKGVTVAVL